jgi:Ni2+-binding GTPase involved in maturation of urease and hydrogenase
MLPRVTRFREGRAGNTKSRLLVINKIDHPYVGADLSVMERDGFENAEAVSLL